MHARWKKCWPWLKAMFAVAIVLAVGRQFFLDLRNHPEIWERSFSPGLIVLSGLLYVFGLGFSAMYWYRLLKELGQQPRFLSALRGYYLGHLGKYVPGKAWALLLRGLAVQGPRVRFGVALLTSFYEVLATMTAGALLAALLLAVQVSDVQPASAIRSFWDLVTMKAGETPCRDQSGLLLLALALGALMALPIFPPFFNRIAGRLYESLRKKAPAAKPALESAPASVSVRIGLLLEGLFVTSLGWLLIGGSFCLTTAAVCGRFPPLDWATWGRFTAYLCVAYVASFVLFVPGGLGVREFLLVLFLGPELERWLGLDADSARAEAVVVALLLRLTWTAAEVLAAGLLYCLPGPSATSYSKEEQPPQGATP